MKARTENDELGQPHRHAACRYEKISLQDYLLATRDVFVAKLLNAKTLNFHLPYEIQFESFRNLKKGERFIKYVNTLAKIVHIPLYWENTSILDTTKWEIIENCKYLPSDQKLTVDIGHLILGSKNKAEALKRIDRIFKKHGKQIHHWHLHINNFKSDQHIHDKKKVITFLGKDRFNIITKNRTYIFEVGH